VTDSSVDLFIDMLQYNETLRTVCLSNCSLSGTSKIKLREATKLCKEFYLDLWNLIFLEIDFLIIQKRKFKQNIQSFIKYNLRSILVKIQFIKMKSDFIDMSSGSNKHQSLFYFWMTSFHRALYFADNRFTGYRNSVTYTHTK
jgi:hypothetical protein